VPPEEIFDQGLGDLFSVRVAGNVLGPDEEASVEYAIEHVKTPLLVIMGHTQCGAVTAAATHAKVGGHLPKLLALIEPAVDAVTKAKPNSKPDDLVREIVAENVRMQVAHLLSSNEPIREAVAAGKLDVVGAVYDIAEGTVKWLGSHPDQAKLLAEKIAEPAESSAPSARPSVAPSTSASASISASASGLKVSTKDEGCEPCQDGPMQSYVFAGLVFLATLGGAAAMFFIKK
jgi:carbonic anhydrase